MKILPTIALGAYMLFNSAFAQTVKTETDIQGTESRKGIASQRIEAKIPNFLQIGELYAKTDIKKKLAQTDTVDNVLTIGLNNIISNDDIVVNTQVNNWGNLNGKDFTYANIFAKTKGETKFAGMIGRGIGPGLPRDFIYGSVEDLAIVEGVKGMFDMQVFSYAPLFEKSRKDLHAIAAFYNDHYALILGKQATAQHIMVGVDGFPDFGYFGWQKYDGETGAWIGRHRFSFGEADEKFYNPSFQKWVARELINPNFYPPHLGPFHTRGKKITAGIEFNGDKKGTLMRLLVGMMTKNIGSFGIGPETYWTKNESTTGMRLGYYNGFKVGDFAIGVEANASVRADIKPAYDGFVTVNYAPE